MAAHLTLNGVDVRLWNRTKENIQDVLNSGTIHCSGIVNGDARISKVSTNIKDVIADFVMVTTPSSAHNLPDANYILKHKYFKNSVIT